MILRIDKGDHEGGPTNTYTTTNKRDKNLKWKIIRQTNQYKAILKQQERLTKNDMNETWDVFSKCQRQTYQHRRD